MRGAETLIGVDVGSQSLKAVVTDLELRVRGEAAGAYQITIPGPWRARRCDDAYATYRVLSASLGPMFARRPQKRPSGAAAAVFLRAFA